MIPLNAGQVRDWKTIPIRDSGHPDPLVPLGSLSTEAGILTSSVYFGEHTNSPYSGDIYRLEGSLLTLFVRQSTAHRLLAAEQLLPTGYYLLVFDAYRPYQVQKSLHDFYKQKLSEKHPYMDHEALEVETQKYVSIPSKNSARPSPHSTGGAVDLAIVRVDLPHEKDVRRIRSHLADISLGIAKRVDLEMQLSAVMRRHARILDFGTAFDHGGKESALTYYESRIAAGEMLTANEKHACYNRRLLFHAMTQAGLQPYFAEWWHFNAPESQMGAAVAGLSFATFRAAELDDSNIAYENTRLRIRQEMLSRLQSKEKLDISRKAPETESLATIHETGDPRLTWDWPVEIIAPSEISG